MCVKNNISETLKKQKPNKKSTPKPKPTDNCNIQESQSVKYNMAVLFQGNNLFLETCKTAYVSTRQDGMS